MRSISQLVLLCIALLVACAPSVDKDTVVLWTAFDGIELSTLQNRLHEFEKSSGQKVVMLKVPFNNLRQKVLVASPARQGPDLLIGPHDWVGLLQTADLLSPIPTDIVDPTDDAFYPIAKQAVSFGGQVYSAPMMMECVVLARNTDLCPTKPESLDQLVSEALACQARNPGVGGFGYQLENLYFSWPFLAGFGADFLAPFNQPTLDVDALKFDTPEAVAGCNWIADLGIRKHKLVPRDMNNDVAVELFLKGRQGMILCGPWNMGTIRSSGVPYILEPLPPGPAAASSPFVGVTGVMIGRYSAEKKGVRELVAYLSSPEVTAELCQSAARAPTRRETAEKLKTLVSDPVLARDLELFARAAQAGTPMPNHPAMSAAVNTSMAGALQLITTDQVDTAEELKRTTERVRAKIRFMTE